MGGMTADGRLAIDGCEITVAQHCNLACRSCTHLAPVLPVGHVDPDQLRGDLAILAKFVRANHVRLMGGEPLLHPKLIDVMEATLRSGLSPRLRVNTNGLDLHRMPEAFWERVHEVRIAIYPGVRIPRPHLEHAIELALRHRVDLRLMYYDDFRESYSELGTGDDRLVRRIYGTCQVAHRWRCYNVFEGHFYKCALAVFIPRVIQHESLVPFEQEGLRIVDSPSFRRELDAYLASPVPLRSCRFCLASVGKRFAHQQVRRPAWRDAQRRSLEDELDEGYLRFLEEVDPNPPDLSKEVILAKG